MKTNARPARRQRKGQSIVEFALSGILLVTILAAAVDLGRAYYTYIVVLNMAGEGSAVLAINPDADIMEPVPPAPSDVSKTFQRRAENVAARVFGAVIDQNNVQDRDVTVSDPVTGLPIAPADRCPQTNFVVKVSYHMRDLFFPALLGFSQLTIGAGANNSFTTKGPGGINCP